ncbi:MAG: potassium-transporting ATPase subunit F [Bacilli bacterium]|nr:potassium-transporting ATPase subunit F [Bacilli bacterium]
MKRSEEEKRLATKRINILLFIIAIALLIYLVYAIFKSLGAF